MAIIVDKKFLQELFATLEELEGYVYWLLLYYGLHDSQISQEYMAGAIAAHKQAERMLKEIAALLAEDDLLEARVNAKNQGEI